VGTKFTPLICWASCEHESIKFKLQVSVKYFVKLIHKLPCCHVDHPSIFRMREMIFAWYSRIENICSVRQQPFEICQICRVRHKLIEIEELRIDSLSIYERAPCGF
jgi:hypothetical protein